jgi:hypothetical protein
MTYQTHIEEMVGKHVAEFQSELTLAHDMKGITSDKPPMPYGYPVRVYHPMHFCTLPAVRHFIAKTGGKLSNGVPRAIASEFVDGNMLGVYNPHRACKH